MANIDTIGDGDGSGYGDGHGSGYGNGDGSGYGYGDGPMVAKSQEQQ